ncbi:hypothetical protein CCP3SC1_20027 [Gammaproteobacteria bacterium]
MFEEWLPQYPGLKHHPSLSLDGMMATLDDQRLSLERSQLFGVLERLVEEEVLRNDGGSYRFVVPLYRRWIAWRWSPEKVREELGSRPQQSPTA